MHIKLLLYCGCLYASISCGFFLFLASRFFKNYTAYSNKIINLRFSLLWMFFGSLFMVLSGMWLLGQGVDYVVTELIVVLLTIWRLNILWKKGKKTKEAK
jgi:hypothetical protein